MLRVNQGRRNPGRRLFAYRARPAESDEAPPDRRGTPGRLIPKIMNMEGMI